MSVSIAQKTTPRARFFGRTEKRLRALSAVATAFFALGCENRFDPASKVNSVRVLAMQANPPYAKPDQWVTLEMLAVDGRSKPKAPMRTYWVPFPCSNPIADSIEGCFAMFDKIFERHVDLTTQLVEGVTHSVLVPSNIIDESSSSQSGTRYATMLMIGFACAGHIEYEGTNPRRPGATPFSCVDETGVKQDTDSFVTSFARIFVFEDRTNTNPFIEALSFDGKRTVATEKAIVARCTTPSGVGEDTSCPSYSVDVAVSESSQEYDPSDLDDQGNPRREYLWVDYYATGGKLGQDVRVVFDPTAGRVSSASSYEAPAIAGEYKLWVVVHDSRGGVSWASIPVQAY